MSSLIYCFGNNQSGQLGCAYTDENSSTPFLVENLSYSSLTSSSLFGTEERTNESTLHPSSLSFSRSSLLINRILPSLHQTEVIVKDGTLFNCGENDSNELGRQGKRSLFGRVDAVEAFSVIDAARG